MENLPRIDVLSDHFDAYFSQRVQSVSERQKELLPKPYLYKLFKGGGKLGIDGSSKFSFLQKVFVLWKLFKSRIYIVVESDEGMNIEDFYKFKEQQKKRDYSIGQAQNLICTETFVLGNKELCDAFGYLNSLSTSHSYAYLSGIKNNKSKISKYRNNLNYFAKYFENYEANKKKMCLESGLDMPEFLILMSTYHRESIKSSDIYKNIYRYSFHASRTRFKLGMSSLQHKGYINKTGVSKGATFSITELGRNKINELVYKYFANV